MAAPAEPPRMNHVSSPWAGGSEKEPCSQILGPLAATCVCFGTKGGSTSLCRTHGSSRMSAWTAAAAVADFRVMADMAANGPLACRNLRLVIEDIAHSGSKGR